jgi:hypothetical protein
MGQLKWHLGFDNILCIVFGPANLGVLNLYRVINVTYNSCTFTLYFNKNLKAYMVLISFFCSDEPLIFGINCLSWVPGSCLSFAVEIKHGSWSSSQSYVGSFFN